MTNEEYLRGLLGAQNLTVGEIATLRSLRDTIQGQLSVLRGNPRFYYGGSYGKDTIIRASYDLDLVVYWPDDCGYALRAIFDAVGEQLGKHWNHVDPKNVAWTLPFDGGFHVDVVPGRALDAAFKYAKLYLSKSDSSLQTSIKVHIDFVRKSQRRDLVRLLKLWKTRRNVPVKSFVLEILGIEGASGISVTHLECQLVAALKHIRDRIEGSTIVDPANSNNNLGDTMTAQEKQITRIFADAALRATTWEEVFRE